MSLFKCSLRSWKHPLKDHGSLSILHQMTPSVFMHNNKILLLHHIFNLYALYCIILVGFYANLSWDVSEKFTLAKR